MGNRIIIFPDAANTRITGAGALSWYVSSSNVMVAVNNGLFSYTAQNSSVANRILALIDAWYFNTTDSILTILNYLGVVIYSISPATQAHNSSATITLTGLNFANTIPPSNVSVYQTGTTTGATYAATWVSATSVTFGYDGSLTAGTYDVVISQQDGSSFTFVGALTLS